MRRVTIEGKGLYLKNISSASTLSKLDIEESNEFFFSPELTIKKRGLKYKDIATRFAICAANKALLEAGIISEFNEKIGTSDIAVIVCSSLGNIDTVSKVIDIIKNKSVDDISPLDLPNLSSNNIAASIAIWFGLTGINLTVCNGSTSSIDSIQIGYNLLQQEKTKKVLIIGVEVLNEYTNKIISIDGKHIQIGAVGLLLGYDCDINMSTSIDICNSLNSVLYDSEDIFDFIKNNKLDAFLVPHNIVAKCNKDSKIISLDEYYGYLDGIYGILCCIYVASLHKNIKSYIVAGNDNEKYKCIIVKKN